MMKYLLALIWLFPLAGLAETFTPGKDYEILTIESSPSKVVKVTEFFSYGCPWCYKIEAPLQHWLEQHKSLSFKRVPVIFNKDWEVYAKAYYTLHFLKLEPKIHLLLFTTIAKNPQALTNYKSMMDFLMKQNIPSATVISAFEHSTRMDMQINRVNEWMMRYHIAHVPAFIINNHYKTDLKMAGNESRLFAILDFLISQSKQDFKSSEIKKAS